MKNQSLLVTVSTTLLLLFPSTSLADARKGQKIFKKNFRKSCGFSGVKFSRNHTQEEWEKIFKEGHLQEETKRICPRIKIEDIKESWWKDIYEFSYEYASDSLKIPSC